MIKPVFQRVIRGDPREAMHVLWQGDRRFCDHGFYQLSNDDGQSWGQAHMLKYEAGPDFDPQDRGAADFFRSNEMYIGGAAVLANGTIAISATIPVEYRDADDEKVPSVFPNDYREGCVAGAVCFVGRWDAETPECILDLHSCSAGPFFISGNRCIPDEMASRQSYFDGAWRSRMRQLDLPAPTWTTRSRRAVMGLEEFVYHRTGALPLLLEGGSGSRYRAECQIGVSEGFKG
ncbi:MAG: hypothetical protein O2782_06190 [bacterium]|nr:hypothetical protein [bacterium]